ncbi:hypothetical protein SAMN04488034_1138 [Salinimicrobium catena]|uniref:Uncharacterized protein n=2 Tax=Salinimicrobium catena TaxID=390640 RepID=A0A1H5PEE5_9FLAO|nr:hypothetical protein SAMN04488140_1138 [Salinimicrobium catena]SEF12060.1 hypothetical protein SAMN04488034_1138 [Salinimicrobium catena]
MVKNNVSLIFLYLTKKIFPRLRNKSILLKQVFLLFLVFGFVKSLVYFAPLGVNEVVNSVNKFGIFEYSLNLGQTVAGVFSMGLAGAYAFFIFKQKRLELQPVFHLHFIIITLALFIAAVLFPGLLNNIYFGAILIGTAFAEQMFLSAVLKFSSRNKTAVIIDSSVYIVLSIVLVFSFFHIFTFSMEIWFSSILVFLLLLSLFYHWRHIKGVLKINRSEFHEIYKFGGLIVLAGPLLVLITSSTRLFIEHFSTLEKVGIYSFYFRLASFVLIFSRVIGILLLKRMFVSSHKVLDKYYSSAMTFLFLLSILIYWILPVLLQNNFPQFDNTYEKYSGLFLICFFQIVFWINTSLFEPILQRENQMKSFLVLLAGFLFLLFLGFSLLELLNLITLENLVWMNTLIIFLLFFGQQFILWKNAIVYKKSLITQSIIGFFFFFTSLIL